jgi:hypothetical protein
MGATNKFSTRAGNAPSRAWLGSARRGSVQLRGEPGSAWSCCEPDQEARLGNGVGPKAKTPPFARCLRRNRRTSRDKTIGRLTLSPTRHRTKTCDEVVPSLRPRPARRPTCDPAHCNRPCVAAARYGPNL